ncbi:type VI secretion system contractile sheath large subunit [uncultured Shewanella sp.]|uniref:type VI secretion system contractile sheath domain-containing protein n=1 Tax=uncultured Shewanella sp. TaxID=173975 RepID=UPI0026342B35|nr:type VI secretion system contractile sheath large subunit [uncultured Shewanella sp.]
MEESVVEPNDGELEGNILTSLKVKTNNIIAKIDRLCSDQLSLILQHKDFIELETAWRSLKNLVRTKTYSNNVLIKVIPLNWNELSKDINLAPEIKRTLLYRLIVNNELNTLGGSPFGILLIDYAITEQDFSLSDYDDLFTLQLLGDLGEVALCPVLVDLSPSFWGASPERLLFDHDRLLRIADSTELHSWRLLRKVRSSQFLGLTMNQFKIRDPYTDYSCGFVFSQRNLDDSILWSKGSFALVANIIREFERSSWFGFLRGGNKKETTTVKIGDKSDPVKPQYNILTSHDRFWADLGIIPLLSCFLSGQGVISSNQSVHLTTHSSDSMKLKNMLQTTLIGCRFSHYIKLLSRYYIGGHELPEQVEKKLKIWIEKYVSEIDYGDDKTMAKYPLYSADISIKKNKEETSYICNMTLIPQLQSTQLKGEIHISTVLNNEVA